MTHRKQANIRILLLTNHKLIHLTVMRSPLRKKEKTNILIDNLCRIPLWKISWIFVVGSLNLAGKSIYCYLTNCKQKTRLQATLTPKLNNNVRNRMKCLSDHRIFCAAYIFHANKFFNITASNLIFVSIVSGHFLCGCSNSKLWTHPNISRVDRKIRRGTRRATFEIRK